jgi:predicted transposase YbfD/YdcC
MMVFPEGRLMMQGIALAFAELTDPRRPNARHHKRLDILAIAFCACLCGAESCVDRAGFAMAKEEVLREFLDLDNGPPSHDTFSRVFRRLDPKAFSACFAGYLERFSAACKGHIAIDGKALRGAQDRAAGGSPLPMVSAFASTARLRLGQRATDAKSNEIPAVRALLSLLSLEGCTVTLDALHAQRQTAQALLDKKADYILALKGNQGDLHDDVRTLLEDPTMKAHSREQTVDGDHGRIETREAQLVTNIAWRQEQHHWPGLACIGKITATREDKGAGTKQTQTRYYLLSRVMEAHEFLDLVRHHGSIENSLHWVLDVVMHEDDSRARKDHAPANLAILRRLALNTIQANPDKGSNRLKFKRAGWDDRFLRQLIAPC